MFNPCNINRHSISLALIFAILCWTSSGHAKHILIFGDSLSAAYGMDLEQGWAALLQQHWQDSHQVSNASISGETTVGGLARLPLTLDELNPDIVVLQLGANDGLRGYAVNKIKQNLIAMIDLIEQSGAQAIIVGISVPPNYGPRYTDQFRAIFRHISQQKELPFIDFYRESFFAESGYIQADGLHPTALTQPIIRDLWLEFFAENNVLN